MTSIVKIRRMTPGLIAASLVALVSYCAALYVPISAMFIALFLGFILHPICGNGAYFPPGVNVSADHILKVGIVCLGARINLAMIGSMGWGTFLIVVIAMAGTTIVGMMLGKALGISRALSILITGAVTVCGSAAALALCSILPKSEKRETDLVFVIVGVTMLSTVGMVVYPFILLAFGLNQTDMGVVLGASLHNVAQAVASGFTVSDQAGDAATIVKLTRVSLLAPYVLLASFFVSRYMDRQAPKKRPAILPLFIIGFFVLTCVNSLITLPPVLISALITLSKAFLLISVAAIGMRTSFVQLREIDASAIKMLVGLTAILFVLSIGLTVLI